MTIQKSFNPVDFAFDWTPDGWYTFDRKAGRAAATKARNAEAKRLEQDGWTVKKWSLPSQLISRGGIGSGRPHIEEVVTVFYLNAWKEVA